MKEELKQIVIDRKNKRYNKIYYETVQMFEMQQKKISLRKIGKKFGISGTGVWYRLLNFELECKKNKDETNLITPNNYNKYENT